MNTLHAKNALILGLLLAAAVPLGAAFTTAVALGGSLQIVNLKLLERGVAYMLGLASEGHGAGMQALLMLRFSAVMAGCVAILVLLPVDPLAFAVGFSSVVPACLWHGLTRVEVEGR